MRGKKLVVAGITLLLLASLLVPGCKGGIVKTDSWTIAHQEEPPSFDEGRVRRIRRWFNVAITQTIDLSISAGEDMPTEGTMYDLIIKTTELLRGDAAWAKLKDNPNNQPAPDGYEYILAKMKFTLKGVSSSARWFDNFEFIIEGSKFRAYTSDTYEQYPYVQNASLPLDQQMYGSMNGGETLEGYVLVEVLKTDAKPILEYISPDVPMWYMLYKVK